MSSTKPKSDEFRIRVSPDFKEEIKEVAERLGLSKSDIARLALREYMDKQQKGESA